MKGYKIGSVQYWARVNCGVEVQGERGKKVGFYIKNVLLELLHLEEGPGRCVHAPRSRTGGRD